jgi:hypothetical protein
VGEIGSLNGLDSSVGLDEALAFIVSAPFSIDLVKDGV